MKVFVNKLDKLEENLDEFRYEEKINIANYEEINVE